MRHTVLVVVEHVVATGMHDRDFDLIPIVEGTLGDLPGQRLRPGLVVVGVVFLQRRAAVRVMLLEHVAALVVLVDRGLPFPVGDRRGAPRHVVGEGVRVAGGVDGFREGAGDGVVLGANGADAARVLNVLQVVARLVDVGRGLRLTIDVDRHVREVTLAVAPVLGDVIERIPHLEDAALTVPLGRDGSSGAVDRRSAEQVHGHHSTTPCRVPLEHEGPAAPALRTSPVARGSHATFTRGVFRQPIVTSLQR